MVNCRKDMLLNKLQFNGEYFFSPEAIEFFGFHPESQKQYPVNPVNPV